MKRRRWAASPETRTTRPSRSCSRAATPSPPGGGRGSWTASSPFRDRFLYWSEEVHSVSVTWSSDIWSFRSNFAYMVNDQSYFSNTFFGYLVILAIWSILPGQNRGPYIRTRVHCLQSVPSARGVGWVDINFDCSTVCPIVPGMMGIWQKPLGSWTRW